jgi:DNA invertase Pin-like site-specific DNA recombinase
MLNPPDGKNCYRRQSKKRFEDAVLAILKVIAKQQRLRLSEPAVAGLEKARKAGRVGGRPKAIADRTKILQMSHGGASTRQIGEAIGISAARVSRLLRNRDRLKLRSWLAPGGAVLLPGPFRGLIK